MFGKSAAAATMPSSSSAGGSGFSNTIFDQTNFERFLDSVTPSLPLHSVSRSRIQGVNSKWLPDGEHTVPYFKLADLWRGFDEASAFGVGSRVLFDDGDVVTQYYSPFLSAIQLYTSKPNVSTRNTIDVAEVLRCDSDISWSDDNESEKVSGSISNHSSPNWEALSDGIGENGSSQAANKHGHLYLNYCEYASPFWRIPLHDKIVELAQTRPEVMTLKSFELSPASWMAILWCPIYNIPSQKRCKDLSTIFLTHYTLSSSFLGDSPNTQGEDIVGRTTLPMKKLKESKKKMVALSPFGLSTFKMSGDTWTKTESDVDKMVTMQNAADSWLKQLGYFHHDFTFHTTHPTETTK